MSGALIGFAGALGALGAMGVNLALRQSYLSTGTETPAFWAFLLCYIGASILTWVRYVRPQGPRITRTCLAAANCGGAGQDVTAPGQLGGMGGR